jgi:LCP family protein required for cell wall assembly
MSFGSSSPNGFNRRPRRFGAFLIVFVLGLALVVLPAAGIIALRVANDVTQRLDRVVGDANATPQPSLSLPDIGVWQGNERLNVLLLGIDQRPDEDPNTARTDTMMLLTIDPGAKTAGMLSIPRDLFVPLPDKGQDRINTAHVYGGSELAKRAVEYNFGIPVHHCVRVNFDALTALIDLAGGVDVYNEQDIDDEVYPDSHFGYEPFALSAGWQHLDGATALKYARTRHNASDFQRIRRQQQIVMALRDKLETTDAATKILPQAPRILQTLSGAIETDLKPIEIVQLALLAKDIPVERIARVAIDETAIQEWTTPEGGRVLIPIRERVRELREQLFNPTTAPQSTAIAPEPGHVAIQNGTQRVGLAAGAKAYLEGKGISVDSVSDAPQIAPKTVIVDLRGRKQFIQHLANELGVPLSNVATSLDASSSLDALVILGDDYQPK